MLFSPESCDAHVGPELRLIGNGADIFKCSDAREKDLMYIEPPGLFVLGGRRGWVMGGEANIRRGEGGMVVSSSSFFFSWDP